jgi:hypothetical protein
MGRKEIIFIHGMARSGTSALTKVLALCGGALPGSLKEANEANPKGFWEPLEAAKLNDEFLSRHDSTFSDPTLRLQGEWTFAPAETERFVEHIRTFLRRCPQGGAPLLIKDARIIALFDFWLPAALAEDYRVKMIVPIRHPMEVAASLATRAQERAQIPASLELRQALWLKYNLLAELQSRQFPRVFIEYSSLLEDWRREVARVSRALDLDLAPDAAAVDEFLTPDLHRQRYSGSIPDVFGQPWVSDTYELLSEAARDRSLDGARLDGILRTYRLCERAFRTSLDDWRRRLPPRPSAEPATTPADTLAIAARG